eukprot:TRINITY_DN10710_c0_g2_i4.p1 TRINITY_DN10710_c0_g2~~TRINITY_DN10710_c0_g2_i4.p1  ORF type:complete len:316 (+),score=16.31 TRINITY_DN10710_c0_g2_i4:54-1001(+)
MVSEGRGRSLTVHFSSDNVDVIEIAAEQLKGSPKLECKQKGYIMGEPSPDPNGEDVTGNEVWMHYYSALTIRIRCAKHQSHRVNQKHARWRALVLLKKIDDPHDEAHLGLVSRKRTKNPRKKILSAAFHRDGQNLPRPFPRHTSASSEPSSFLQQISESSDMTSFPRQASACSDIDSFPRQSSACSDTSWLPRQTSECSDMSSFPRQTSAKSVNSLSSKASSACRRWLSSWSAAGKTNPSTYTCPQSSGDETFQDNALNDSECTCSERSADESGTTGESADTSPIIARMRRMAQWAKAAKGKRTRVHVSFDSIIS